MRTDRTGRIIRAAIEQESEQHRSSERLADLVGRRLAEVAEKREPDLEPLVPVADLESPAGPARRLPLAAAATVAAVVLMGWALSSVPNDQNAGSGTESSVSSAGEATTAAASATNTLPSPTAGVPLGSLSTEMPPSKPPSATDGTADPVDGRYDVPRNSAEYFIGYIAEVMDSRLVAADPDQDAIWVKSEGAPPALMTRFWQLVQDAADAGHQLVVHEVKYDEEELYEVMVDLNAATERAGLTARGMATWEGRIGVAGVDSAPSPEVMAEVQEILDRIAPGVEAVPYDPPDTELVDNWVRWQPVTTS